MTNKILKCSALVIALSMPVAAYAAGAGGAAGGAGAAGTGTGAAGSGTGTTGATGMGSGANGGTSGANGTSNATGMGSNGNAATTGNGGNANGGTTGNSDAPRQDSAQLTGGPQSQRRDRGPLLRYDRAPGSLLGRGRAACAPSSRGCARTPIVSTSIDGRAPSCSLYVPYLNRESQ